MPLRNISRLLLCCLASSSLALSALAQTTATIDVNTRYQTFEGWGTSLAWWANVVGNYPAANRNDYMSKFFDPVDGLGLNVVRYNIGGGENPNYLPPNQTYIQYRARVPGYLAGPNASYDWTQDAGQRLILQQAMQQGATIAEAFSNSPPYWMTNSGSVTGATDSGNNLNPSYASAFADYLTTVVQHFHDTWGVTFRTLEPFNEPASGYWHFGGNQEGCGFDPSTQNTDAKLVGAALASKGIGYTSLSTSDETSIDQALSTLAVMDPTSLGYIAQINTHTYGGSKRGELSSAVAAANKRMWMSEYGDGDASGLSTAAQIVRDVNGLKTRSWVYWQAVDSASGWGFVQNALDGTSNYGYLVNKKYYAVGNFTRFIRPGYQIVSMTDSNSLAATDGHGTVVIVTVSQSSTDQAVTYNLNNFGTGSWNIAQYRTSASENLQQLPPSTATGGTFTKVIPANSVTTFVVTNNQAGPFVSGRTYALQNASNGFVLEVPGSSTQPGQPLDQAANSQGDNQLWTVTSAGANWLLTNTHSGLAMDVAGTSPNSLVIQNTATHKPGQIWALTAVGDGTYTLSNASTGFNLEAAKSGIAVDQAPNDGTSRQHWNLTEVQRPTDLSGTQTALTSFQTPVSATTANALAATVTTSSKSALTGSVTFYDGSAAIGTVAQVGAGGVARLSATLPAGTHYISAAYSGDAHNASSSSNAVTVVVTGQPASLFVPGKPYLFINVNSGLALDVPGASSSAGATLDQYTANGGSNQQWTPALSGSNIVWTNRNSGLAIDLSSNSAGSAATQNTVSGSATQAWNTLPVGDGSYKLVNAATGYNLEIGGASQQNGATVDQWYENNGSNQHWIIAQQADSFAAGRTYFMLNLHSGLALEVPGFSTAAGTAIDQYISNNGTNQLWTPTASGSSWIWQNVNSSLALDVASASAGASAVQNQPNGSATQLWTPTLLPNGTFKFTNAATNFNLEVGGAYTNNGATVDQWYDNNGDNQHWIVGQLPILVQTPAIAWPVPSPIAYGTPLSATQLNASATVGGATVPGTLTYNPPSGSVLTSGSHVLTASFAPADPSRYTGANGSVTLQVNRAASTTTLSAPGSVASGSPVTLSATVAGPAGVPAPTGTVQFFEGTTSLGTASLANGSASTSVASLAPGTHIITASYRGDSNNLPSSSNPSAVTVVGLPQLATSATLTRRSDGSYLAAVTVRNSGNVTASAVTVTGFSLGSAASSSVPLPVGNLVAGASATVTAVVPGAALSSGSTVLQRIAGTYTGGTFGTSLRVRLP